MIFCKELNKEFATKAEMFAELKKNCEKIIGLKKAAIKNSDPVSYVVKNEGVTKEAPVTVPSEVKLGDHIFPVINCTNWLDSHGDVHLDGIWDQSVKDNKGKLYYIINHDLEIGKVISYPDEVRAYVQTLNWADLGQGYVGTTQALIFDAVLTDASNKDAANAILAKKAIQNSVRMQYIEIILCIDDTSDDYKQEYANFYKYLAVIANKQDAMDAGYFWAVAQAKIVKEGSAVLFGSNEATPILYADPADAGQENKQEPAESSSLINKNLHTLFI